MRPIITKTMNLIQKYIIAERRTDKLNDKIKKGTRQSIQIGTTIQGKQQYQTKKQEMQMWFNEYSKIKKVNV